MARKVRVQYPGAIYHVMNRGDHREFIFIDRLLGEWRIEWDVPGAGRQFAVVMEARRQAELDEEFKPVRRGWCLGSKEFRAEMLKYIETQTGKWHYGAELRESVEAKAERLIAEALCSGGLNAHHLVSWRKGHPFKIKLAAQLREQTTVTVAWIAERLSMGSRGHLMHLLHLNGKDTDPGNGHQRTLEI